MRFAELTLERYGRLEDCRVAFRPGAPDLHVIYGANEAGKSTTLSAVSDLLFGFPHNSPFGFRFDNTRLRVGAVLEEGDARLVCRRRKTRTGSLVDVDDQPIDDGPLLAMLRGQSRETFRLGFSLDQARLREGGRAMVDARHDLGQALFAAGSGLTEVSGVLAALEREADDIWAPRAAARRAYTAAERRLAEAQGQLRDLQLRPKAYSDARKLLEAATEIVEALRGERTRLATEQRGLERLRRIAPDARRRAELQALLQEQSARQLAPHVEEAAEAALAVEARAERDRTRASAQLDDVVQRLEAEALDEAVLARGAEIDALIERRGSETKAQADLGRRRTELAEKEAQAARLQADVGGAPGVARLVIARLRELAARDAELRAGLASGEVTRHSGEARAAPLRAEVADAQLDEGWAELVGAVDAARALGADIDSRCAGLARTAERLDLTAADALSRLAPWAGDAAGLASLPIPGDEEVEAAHVSVARAADEAAAAAQEADTADGELAVLALERQSVAETEGAVSAEAVQEARASRDTRWGRLRVALTGHDPLENPVAAAADFDESLQSADAIADSRFAAASASGRLAALDLRVAQLELKREQAAGRRRQAQEVGEAGAKAWAARLKTDQLPALPPVRLRGWLKMRQEALAAHAAAADARAALEGELDRRSRALQRLSGPTPAAAATGADDLLGPVLERATAMLAIAEERRRRFSEARGELGAVEVQLTELARERERLEAERARGLTAWEQERSAAGLELAIDGAELRLAALDELRGVEAAAADIRRRIEAIGRDTLAFKGEVDAVADALGEASAEDPGSRLERLRERLAQARASAVARHGLLATQETLSREVRAAELERDAALATMAPILLEAGAADISDLPKALEASRTLRTRREEMTAVERRLADAGDGHPLEQLCAVAVGEDPDALAGRAERLLQDLADLDDRIAQAADAAGSARQAFEALDVGPGAAQAAEDAALARAELDEHAEAYLLRRAQAAVLRWALDRYRERRQNPLLLRASEIFRTLTLERYRELHVDHEAATPRLLGVCQDGATLVDLEGMSEGTSDQLFLALRLAAVEQAIEAGVRLPFLADDLFVNFDDARARAGLRVLAELAQRTQVLVFSHHEHIVRLARDEVGADLISECRPFG